MMYDIAKHQQVKQHDEDQDEEYTDGDALLQIALKKLREELLQRLDEGPRGARCTKLPPRHRRVEADRGEDEKLRDHHGEVDVVEQLARVERRVCRTRGCMGLDD